jgi:predicted acylesterase/phospholipase RssA
LLLFEISFVTVAGMIYIRKPDEWMALFVAFFLMAFDLTAPLMGPNKLYFLATDLNAGGPVVFGLDPDESVLDAVLASMTLPPWMAPVQRGKQYMIDGGIVSNVPIETAIHQGATKVIALDILRMTETEMQAMHESGHFLSQINHALEN